MGNILKAQPIVSGIKKVLLSRRKRIRRKPSLAVVNFLPDVGTRSYVSSQKRWAEILDVGYFSFDCRGMSKEEILNLLDKINRSRRFDGVILHKPFPKRIDKMVLLGYLDVFKDVEGMHPYSMGMLVAGRPLFIPPTVLSVLELLKHTGVSVRGKNVVIVGYSEILGKPLSVMLTESLATVSVVHIGTYEAGNLAAYIRRADILISAVGKPHLIKGDWIKRGAVVVDVGLSQKNGRLMGDVEFEKAVKRASFITPVPGGVGSLTVAFLYSNLLAAAAMNNRD